jgi:uronate dehydrogenase
VPEVFRRIVMTGAAGSIGRAITPLLAERWELHLTDRVPGVGSVLDVRNAEACRTTFAGADAVIHLAANPDRMPLGRVYNLRTCSGPTR